MSLGDRPADALGAALWRENVAVKTLPPTLIVGDGPAPRDYNALRFSTHVYNHEEELDRVIRLLVQLLR